MNKEQMLRAGGDLVRTTTGQGKIPMNTEEDKLVARRAAHNILFTVANSCAMDQYVKGTTQVALTPVWKIALYALDAVFGALLLYATVKTANKYRKMKQCVVQILPKEEV